MKFTEINESNFPEAMSIYLDGIATGLATFETSAPDWNTWDNNHLPFGRIAITKDHTMLGWAALSPVSSRCVYGGVAEVSVYIAESARGQGIGTTLLKELIRVSEQNNIWTLQSGIFRDNRGSIALHEKCGFRIIGFKEKIGKLNGVWMDNMLLERRSLVVGV